MPDPWFQSSRFGFGVGLPIRWQGWALVVVFLVALVLIHRFADFVAQPLVRRVGEVVAALIVAALLLLFARRRTAGGERDGS
jgi:undecaprenyl pyrophosphate phosphatase UppP